mgnify:CR=1 FL=1
MIGFALLGCNAERQFQKQKKKATDFFLLNRSELAELCDREFPEVPVRVVPGDTIKNSDTIFIPGPKLVCPDSVTTLDCPPTKIIKDSIIIRDSVFYKDTDREYILNTKIEELASEKEVIKLVLEQTKDSLRVSDNKKTQWFWVLIALAAINVIYFGFKIYLKFQKP